MIFLKSSEEVELIRQSSLLVSKTLAEVGKAIKPGVSTLKLDTLAEEFIKDHKGFPAFKGYEGYKHSLCISVNQEIVHGIPSDKILQEGDIVSVDCGVVMNGYYGDSAYTFPVGDIKPEVEELLRVTLESLYKGIAQAADGKRLGDISHAIQDYTESYGYGVVRELVGHGIGKSLHEDPQVPNYGKRGSGIKLKKGMVLAIEPMINLGVKNVRKGKDGWTIITKDNKPSAHFEHTIAIREGEADILSTFDYIDEVVKKDVKKLSF